MADRSAAALTMAYTAAASRGSAFRYNSNKRRADFDIRCVLNLLPYKHFMLCFPSRVGATGNHNIPFRRDDC